MKLNILTKRYVKDKAFAQCQTYFICKQYFGNCVHIAMFCYMIEPKCPQGEAYCKRRQILFKHICWLATLWEFTK